MTAVPCRDCGTRSRRKADRRRACPVCVYHGFRVFLCDVCYAGDHRHEPDSRLPTHQSGVDPGFWFCGQGHRNPPSATTCQVTHEVMRTKPERDRTEPEPPKLRHAFEGQTEDTFCRRYVGGDPASEHSRCGFIRAAHESAPPKLGNRVFRAMIHKFQVECDECKAIQWVDVAHEIGWRECEDCEKHLCVACQSATGHVQTSEADVDHCDTIGCPR